MLDRLKAVKNHLLLTLEEVKEVQAAQYKNDELHHEVAVSSSHRMLGHLASILHILEDFNSSLSNTSVEDKTDRLLETSGDINQQIAHLVEQITPAISRHDLVMMHVQPLNEKSDQLKNEIAALSHWMQQIERKLEQQVESQKHLRADVAPVKEKFSSTSALAKYLLSNPEVSLLMHLRTVLPGTIAVDIGANKGDVSEALLACGYEVFAFEPLPESYQHLIDRFDSIKAFHALPFAVGASNEQRELLTVAVDEQAEHLFESDLSVYAGLVEHALPEGMRYASKTGVSVKTLEALHADGTLPDEISILKIDTEGNDLAVIQGMVNAPYRVVVAEFWDSKHFFSNGQFGLLKPLVSAMREKGYHWHIVVYRVCTDMSSTEPRFFCNFDDSVENSWGNVLFFKNFDEFKVANYWCQGALRETQLFG